MVPELGLITLMELPSEERKSKLLAPTRSNHTKSNNTCKLTRIFLAEIPQLLFYKELRLTQIIYQIGTH